MGFRPCTIGRITSFLNVKTSFKPCFCLFFCTHVALFPRIVNKVKHWLCIKLNVWRGWMGFSCNMYVLCLFSQVQCRVFVHKRTCCTPNSHVCSVSLSVSVTCSRPNVIGFSLRSSYPCLQNKKHLT